MDKEIEVPDFVNDNYYRRKYEESSQTIEENKKTIHKLKIYNKVIKLIALGATLALAGTNPKVQKALNVMIETIVERDNQKFNEQAKQYADSVEEMTGRTTEEILDAGKSIH